MGQAWTVLGLLVQVASVMTFELWLDLQAGSAAVTALPAKAAAAFDKRLMRPSVDEQTSLRRGVRRMLSPELSDDDDENDDATPVVTVTPSGRLLAKDGALVGAISSIDSADDQQDAMALIGSVGWVLVEPSGAADVQLMITAENLIAAAQDTGTRLAVRVRGAEQVGGLAFALQTGVDALVVWVL